MSIQTQTLPFWATLFMLLGVCILCVLGTWQLQRLEWKESLLETIEHRNAQNVTTFAIQDLTKENEFRTGTLNGTFLFTKEFTLQPRTHDGTPGVHVITPFVLDDNSTILVNRGWAPLDYAHSNAPNKRSAITATLRAPQKPNFFTPPNTPKDNQWYAIIMDEITAAKNLNALHSIMLYQIQTQPPPSNVQYPDANALEIHVNNNHVQYALFWFALAAILIGVYVLRFIVKPRLKEKA